MGPKPHALAPSETDDSGLDKGEFPLSKLD